jgi:hypothetical protein
VALGCQAGFGVTTGGLNIFIGELAGYQDAAGSVTINTTGVLPHPRMFPAVLVIASIRCSIASLIQRQLPLSHFLSSAPCGGPSFVPAALPSRRRAQWRSRLAASLAATEGLALRATSTTARSKRYGARQVVSD